ncbi:MAG: hypothetical protein GTO45_28205 [Candidatus Aminicenantes bacterium]|nr:hypothetical protein [Candidatus Aminicenantes bacterium]NIM82684.1 hypothetical protein [Candidatus Aminicenantes bacterium]NIN22057.1 hypothetical protein [Candidatus Aminicenantes bacterium]NIN45814.1 hypothetical protein [Candidatus Aminicenantes bacterium]NIN88652.1 hypothetical protein [Candidatus Aminicenantes bacterium]
MYTREQIIEEIKRIAKEIGAKSLKEEEFERHSTIPISTVKFHIGSWNRALKDAGLQVPGKSIDKTGKREPKHDDELLLDLLRLNEDSGEVPTLALIQEKGKYSDRHYRDRWKSIAEAFALAQEKFPKKPKKAEIPISPEINLDIIHKERDLLVEKEKTTSERQVPEEPQPEPQLETAVDVGVGMDMDVNGEAMKMNTNTKIKFIPQTIKPKKTIKKRRLLGEALDFRGLRFAPTNKEGVIYLFGMISHELGFIIEAFREEFPSAEGKRCLGIEGPDITDQQTWEQVKIEFEYKSSDFQAHGFGADQCDIIVCWFHDWDDCPVEVLELKSTIHILKES